jgi:hypothetical protein
MKIKMILLCMVALLATMCDRNAGRGPMSREVLISKNFIDDNSFRIVCRGFPEPGLTGIKERESARQAARLNAYYFIKSMFTDAVAPDRDGREEEMTDASDHAVIYYVISRKGLKKYLRPEPKEEPVTDANQPAGDTGGGESGETKNK